MEDHKVVPETMKSPQKDLWETLTVDDIFRFLQASQASKDAATAYLKNHPELIPEIEVDENEKSLDRLLELGIPVSNLFINNSESGVFFYDKWSGAVNTFLDLYGAGVTHLKLTTLGRVPLEKERDFLNRLPNVDSIIALNWVAIPPILQLQPVHDKLQADWKAEGHTAKFKIYPDVFKIVKCVDIGLQDCWSSDNDIKDVMFSYLNYANGITCPRLESVALPFISVNQDLKKLAGMARVSADPPSVSVLGLFFLTLQFALESKSWKPVSLKEISFKNFYYEDPKTERARQVEVLASSQFMDVAETCAREGIMLKKVNSAWFQCARTRSPENLGTAVVSMVNIHPSVIDYVRLDNLQELDVFTSRSFVVTDPDGGPFQANEWNQVSFPDRPEWPALKTLRITVDSIMMDMAQEKRGTPGTSMYTKDFIPTPPSQLFPFLFRNVVALNLRELSLDFKDLSGSTLAPSQAIVDLIVGSCPSVTKLALENWTGTNKALISFWTEMKQLEEVKLQNCKALGNVAFVGEDMYDPVFIKLRNLKKLSLIGLDKMPKISDTLFISPCSKPNATYTSNLGK